MSSSTSDNGNQGHDQAMPAGGAGHSGLSGTMSSEEALRIVTDNYVNYLLNKSSVLESEGSRSREVALINKFVPILLDFAEKVQILNHDEDIFIDELERRIAMLQAKADAIKASEGGDAVQEERRHPPRLWPVALALMLSILTSLCVSLESKGIHVVSLVCNWFLGIMAALAPMWVPFGFLYTLGFFQ